MVPENKTFYSILANLLLYFYNQFRIRYYNILEYILTDNTEQRVRHAHDNFTFSIESGIQQHNDIIY